MANKNSKKGGFTLTPITLSKPIKATDGFTNLVEPVTENEKTIVTEPKKISRDVETKKSEKKREVAEKPKVKEMAVRLVEPVKKESQKPISEAKSADDLSLTINELLKILDAEGLDEIYELTDVLRASSLKLYATLIQLADSRGRARAKNHELMSKAGIKGIATLYKQERWLMDLKLLEKKAKPGPHDGSSYVVHKLETLPLPAEILEKFDDYLSAWQTK